MDIVWLIIGIPFAIFMLIGFSFLIGHGFRQWNEGKRYEEEKGSKSQWKTFAIGLGIIGAIAFFASKCSG